MYRYIGVYIIAPPPRFQCSRFIHSEHRTFACSPTLSGRQTGQTCAALCSTFETYENKIIHRCAYREVANVPNPLLFTFLFFKPPYNLFTEALYLCHDLLFLAFCHLCYFLFLFFTGKSDTFEEFMSDRVQQIFGAPREFVGSKSFRYGHLRTE